MLPSNISMAPLVFINRINIIILSLLRLLKYPDEWQAGLRISPKHPDGRQEDLRRRAAATQTHISPERSCTSAVY